MHKLASKAENVKEVERILHVIGKKVPLCEETYNNMLISLTEAVNNAILHGNCEDEGKYVSIKVKQFEDVLQVVVEDEGEGFNPDDLPDPTEQENISKCGGRGVFLITQLCDSVHYQNNGSTVEMNFKIK